MPLEREERRQHAVQDLRRATEVMSRHPQHAFDEADSRNGREEDRIEVTYPLHSEACLFDPIAQQRGAITAPVSEYLVVRGP